MKQKCKSCPPFSSIDPQILTEIHVNLQEIKTWVRLYALNQGKDCVPDLKGIANTIRKINSVLTLIASIKTKESVKLP